MKKLTCLAIALSALSASAFAAEENKDYAYMRGCSAEMIKKATTMEDLCYKVDSKDSFNITKKNNNKYKVRVVVVGESTNKNYMNAFGYPLNNTPFLSSVNGKFFSNAISAASNTIPTLTRSLVKNNIEEITNHKEFAFYSNNDIVSLARKAGYTTYYIGNNGNFSKYDVGFTNHFLKANYFAPIRDSMPGFDNLYIKDFKPAKNFSTDKVTNDFKGLPYLKAALNNNPAEEKVIFLHVWGPHHNGWPTGTCETVEHDYGIDPRQFNTGWGAVPDCYVTAIKVMDAYLGEVYQALKDNNKDGKAPFSILFFSDHGQGLVRANQSHKDKEESKELASKMEIGDFYIRHGEMVKGAYQIPLVIMNSDDKDRKYSDAKVSTWNLFDYTASWLGVETSITSKDKDLTKDQVVNEKDVKVYNYPQEKYVLFDSLPQDTTLSPLYLNKDEVVADDD